MLIQYMYGSCTTQYGMCVYCVFWGWVASCVCIRPTNTYRHLGVNRWKVVHKAILRMGPHLNTTIEFLVSVSMSVLVALVGGVLTQLTIVLNHNLTCVAVLPTAMVDHWEWLCYLIWYMSVLYMHVHCVHNVRHAWHMYVHAQVLL